MSRQRPGGLTALAVINFIFAGLDAILFLIGLVQFLNLDAVKQMAAEANAPLPPDWYFFYAFMIKATLATLLLVSGIGYIKLKKKMGRGVGNVYGVVSIADTILAIAVGAEFSMFALLFAVYPVLTLLSLNLIFKDDFE